MSDDRTRTAEQHTERRRRARDGILDLISAAGEPSPRDMLRVMLVLVEEIGDKIDAVLANERGLRETVLNGHADVHHEHHEWVRGRIESGCEIACRWAMDKMAEEEREKEAAEELVRAGKKKAVETFVGWAVVALLSSVVGALAALQFIPK